MANRKMRPEGITAWETLYAKDLLVIGGFLDFLKETNGQYKTFRMFFSDGTKIIAKFCGASDGDNGLDLDDPDFQVKKIERKGSELSFDEEQLICLDYRNFFIKFEPYDEQL